MFLILDFFCASDYVCVPDDLNAGQYPHPGHIQSSTKRAEVGGGAAAMCQYCTSLKSTDHL